MNIVNTMLIASGLLLSKGKSNKTNSKVKLPNFIGILEVKHYMPGRIRLNCPILKQNEVACMALVDTCNKIKGIKNIDINSYIGSILIEYDSLEPVLIMGIILKVLGLEEEVKNNPKSLIDKESINISESLNHAIYEKTGGILDLKNMIMILIGGYALYDIKVRPGVRPCGYTCLWWVYSSLAKKF